MQNFGGIGVALISKLTLEAGSVNGIGRLAPVSSELQETPKESIAPAVSVKNNVLILQNTFLYTAIKNNQLLTAKIARCNFKNAKLR